MLYPSIDTLVEKVGSKYLLVIAASRRSRVLKEDVFTKLEKPRSHKSVGVALEELYHDYIELIKKDKAYKK